ncbi:MAG: PP2C family protein-serine/threonine phosphatase [Bacteroidota bacterium]
MAAIGDIRDLELNALLEITQAINNNLPETDLYRIYRFTLLADLQVRKLAVFLHDEEWHCKVHFGSEVNWSEEVLPEKHTTYADITEIEEEDAFNEFSHVFPVHHKDKLLAVVFIGGYNPDTDITFLRALTNILIVAIENKKLARRQLKQEAYRKELEIAKKVQNFLFPKQLPKSTRLKIDAVYLPHQDVGGDYYDYISLGDNRFIVCIADVSGKGVPAALLMSNFQASLRTLVRKTEDLEEIIVELNHSTCSSSNGENFITFFIGLYDFNSRVFEYVNCGHNPSYLLTGQGVKTLEEGTTILGMFHPLPFLSKVRVEDLQQFLFFAYTDGLTEAFNKEDEQFGDERLVQILSDHWHEDLNKVHQHVFKALDDFREDTPYHDDITMISCQVDNGGEA